MDNFQVPIIQNTSLVSPKKASEEAFYASATSRESDLVGNYSTAKADLEQTGRSDFVEQQKAKWNQEQDQANKDTISGIMGDKTISNSIKKSLLQGYAMTGSLPVTLKDKYIQKVAISPEHNTIDDKESQDTNVEVLGERVNNNNTDTVSQFSFDGAKGIFDILAKSVLPSYQTSGDKPVANATASIASSILLSIPAGFAGLYQTIKDQDPARGIELINEIQSYLYEPKDKASQLIRDSIMRAVEYLNIPAKKIGDFLNTAQFTKTPETIAKLKAMGITDTSTPKAQAALATAGELILNPLNYLPLGIKGAKFIPKEEGIIARMNTPKVPVDSPLEITNIANPKVAEKVAVTVLKEPTNNAAVALGVDKGQIVHDWVLPKLFPEEVAKTHPDLMEAINAADTTIRETFQDLRYDPNIINATNREAEVAQVFDIMKQSRTPYYQQSMSLINETNQLFEGNAVFGRSGSGGYVRPADAQKAYDNLKQSIDTLPEEQRGTLAIVKKDGQHYINWQWKKEYNEIQDRIFGKDSIQTSVLGRDVSGVARSAVGRYLFPTGRFPQWLEFGALRGIERASKIRDDLTKTIRENITTSKHKEELNHLINDAEETGTDYYSKERMGGMFPKLSTSEINNLFETHTWWRRQQQYNHNFMNREVRNQLVKGDMKGLYDKDGNYLGHATDKVSPTELDSIKEVWDYDKGIAVGYNKDLVAQEGRTVVRLHDKISGEDTIHRYALTGKDAKLDLLPQEVLARIPGYSGRKVKESWYVDVTPKELTVDGVREFNKEGLSTYTETKAAAKSEFEGSKIVEQLQAKYPNSIVKVRPERIDNFGRVLTDYQIHQEFLKHSMKRGERLPSLNGPARLEDRMLTLLNTTSTISRMGAFSAWDDAFKQSFIKGFSKFTKGEFPQYTTDIKPLDNMDRVLKQEYDTAHALFKYYEGMKNNETRGDFIYTKALHSIADILEKWKLPAGFVDQLRGKHQNPLMAAKTISTVAYIHMAPIRQHLIQPAQQLEMYAINPKNAAKNFSNTGAIRIYLGADSNLLKEYKDILQSTAKLTGEKAGNKEFLEDVAAIKRSGMLQSVDMNSIVHGVFREVDRALVENVPEKIWKDIVTSAKAIPRLSRSVGFDTAELNNRVGNWLQVKDLWKEKNPGKDWKTKEAQEEIAAEASRLSGAMNRAGTLPYQDGVLSIFFQFAAINHKMLLNLFQDNATILSGTQRAKLAAARFALYGGKYGIPGGVIAYNFIEKSKDSDVKKYAEQIKRGSIDYATNGLLNSFIDPKNPVDLAVSKPLSPYSDGFLPYFQVGWETMKLFDNQPAGPRYPAMGMISSFGQAIEDMQGWWITREVNPTTFPRMTMEAAEVASGFNSYSQGLLMLGIRDKVTKMGNKYGLEFTTSEAYAKMLTGLGTQKEEDLWQLVQLDKDTLSQKKAMAQMIFRQMSNQRVKGNEEEYDTKVRKLNSFISLLDPNHFSEADKLDVINEVEKLDTSSFKTVKQSILVDHWKYYQEKRTEEWRQVDDILRRSTDPDTKAYIQALDKGRL